MLPRASSATRLAQALAEEYRAISPNSRVSGLRHQVGNKASDDP